MSGYPSSEALMAEASRTTGLSDFGPGDFREGLDMLIQSLERDANLAPEGVANMTGILRRRLTNRLEIEAWYRTHPEVERQTVLGPISIIGLPRTGSTALGNMMSLDDQFRSLRIWEQAKPCPPPILKDEATDSRRVAAVNEFDQIVRNRPDQAAMHIFEADASTEDTEVLGLQFRAQQFTVPVLSYHAWWRDTDMRATFAYHRRVAQLLQSRRPPNLWLFKAPHHKFHLEALLSAYPDTRFIMTHRDPAKVVPSYVSFVLTLFPTRTGDTNDPKRIGRHVSEHLRIGMERAMAARARIGEHRFLDVYHREFERDAFGTLQRIYDFLGLEFPPHVRDQMRRWQEVNHSGAHGAHRYTAEQFGLSKDQLRSDYDFYIRHFDVPVEG